MKKLSPEIIEQVKKMLPKMRKETLKELTWWREYLPTDEFYSDEKTIQILPFAAYEYLSIAKGMKVDKATIVKWLNDGFFNEELLRRVLTHSLRRMTIKKVR